MAFFSWWYGEGWRRQVSRISARMDALFDYFSFDLLLRTLFAPFRQISAGRVNGPIGLQFRAWLDRLVSRFVGAMVRSAVLIAGIVAVLFAGVIAVVQLVLWPILPLAPVIGAILAIAGWVPWR